MRRLVWFSCGATSAVLAKLAVKKYGSGCEVLYCNTMPTEHEDNYRFFSEVEVWIGREITVLLSDKYDTVDDVFEKTRYMSGVKGARCTSEMKKIPREKYAGQDDIHLFGYAQGEEGRAQRFEDNNPALNVDWLLIEEGVTKEMCFMYLEEAGIKLPAMYGLGFDHNNCLGCVKATSAGYWNRTRKLFPEVFERRARQSRLLGVRLVRWGGVRMFLDELPVDADAPDDEIECGPVCQTPQNIA